MWKCKTKRLPIVSSRYAGAARHMEAYYGAKREREANIAEGKAAEKRVTGLNGHKLGLNVSQLAAVVEESEAFVEQVLRGG